MRVAAGLVLTLVVAMVAHAQPPAPTVAELDGALKALSSCRVELGQMTSVYADLRAGRLAQVSRVRELVLQANPGVTFTNDESWALIPKEIKAAP